MLVIRQMGIFPERVVADDECGSGWAPLNGRFFYVETALRGCVTAL